MAATVATVAYLGLEARAVEVQVQLSAGLPRFTIVGLPDKAVAESRERVRAALAAIGLALPPKTITINEDEVREALYDCVGTIVETVRVCLERIPPEIAADMVDNGIVLTGGGSLLAGLDDIIRKETYLPVTIAKDPLSCVALGIGALLDDVALLERVSIPQ